MAKLINQFGSRVRALRQQRELTLEQLGKAAGLGFKHVAEIERGVKVPSFHAIERLAKALAAEPYELFLPERLRSGDLNQNLQVLIRDIERRGDPHAKRFVVDVLSAARLLLDASA